MALDLDSFQPPSYYPHTRTRTPDLTPYLQATAHSPNVTHHHRHLPSEGAGVRDARILDQAKEALRASGYEQLKRISLHCHHSRIVLQGRVPTYFLKQVAQEAVRTVCDVREIDNDLQVVCAR